MDKGARMDVKLKQLQEHEYLNLFVNTCHFHHSLWLISYNHPKYLLSSVSISNFKSKINIAEFSHPIQLFLPSLNWTSFSCIHIYSSRLIRIGAGSIKIKFRTLVNLKRVILHGHKMIILGYDLLVKIYVLTCLCGFYMQKTTLVMTFGSLNVVIVRKH
jgi:hypothetical protein